jgi:hypothetical protein
MRSASLRFKHACHERAGSRAGASTTRPPPRASLSTVQGSDATGPPAALEHVGPRPLLPLSVDSSQSRAWGLMLRCTPPASSPKVAVTID